MNLMKFYITTEEKNKIENSFINLNAFLILDVQEIVNNFNLDLSKRTNVFMVNDHIEKIIINNAKSKRLQGIIYINTNLSTEVIDNLYNIINNTNISKIVLLDDYYNPKVKHLYKLFEEILFFPSIKKVKIVECKPLTFKK